MKKLILLSILFIAGCDNNSTQSSVNPLVGIWEASEMTMTLEGTTITMELNDPTSDIGTMTYIFGADGVFTTTSVSSYGTENDNGTWSSTGGKLTLFDEEDTVVLDYTISGNTLTFTGLETEDGFTLNFTVTLIRQ